MVAYIHRLAVERRKWLHEEAFRDGVVLCQTIPGATAMQVAAYVGYRVRGVLGAAASFIGFGLPAFILMLILSVAYGRTNELPRVVSAFSGLQAIIVAIVANATLSFGRNSLRGWRGWIIAAVAAGMFWLRISPILAIALAALLGVVSYGRPPKQAPVEKVKSAPEWWPIGIILGVTVVVLALLFFFRRGLFDLATLMVKVDLFAFGGGFASLPLMFHQVVEVRHWMGGPTFSNGIALGQVTPGPIVITATFVGYLLAGLPGAIAATVGVFLPSFLVLVTIVPYFDRLRTSLYFNRAFVGILSSFVGLLLVVTVRFGLNVPWDLPRILLAGGALILLLHKVDVVWVVLLGAAISVFVV